MGTVTALYMPIYPGCTLLRNKALVEARQLERWVPLVAPLEHISILKYTVERGE